MRLRDKLTALSGSSDLLRTALAPDEVLKLVNSAQANLYWLGRTVSVSDFEGSVPLHVFARICFNPNFP